MSQCASSYLVSEFGDPDLEFTNEVEIRRGAREVFAFLTDFTNLPRWNHALRTTRKTTVGPVALGTRYRQVRTVPTIAEETFEVTELHPGRCVAISGDFGPFTGTLTYRVAQTHGGTVLTNDVQLWHHRDVGLRGWIARARLQDAMQANLETLAHGLERGF